MLTPKEHFHGSDLEKIEQIYHIKKEEITSFGANVNPLGISPLMKKTLAENIDVVTSYPDREYTNLRKAIGTYVGADYRSILVGNGATELISLFIQLHHPKKALLLAPTYSEYEREIHLAGGECFFHFLKEENQFELCMEELKETLKEDFDLLIICNPNNPTSTALSSNTMREILSYCKEKNIFVIVDETYVEFAPNTEEITSVPLTKEFENLVVLRGISKFFASPGLRLGYSICGNLSLLETMKKEKNPWTINSLASLAGEVMFSDIEYIKATKQLISSERDRACERLASMENVSYIQPTGNFILCKILRDDITASDLFDICIRKGLMIRDCVTFEGLSPYYFRFCMMSPEKNKELLNTIEETLHSPQK